jgi:hypothetical protein
LSNTGNWFSVNIIRYGYRTSVAVIAGNFYCCALYRVIEITVSSATASDDIDDVRTACERNEKKAKGKKEEKRELAFGFSYWGGGYRAHCFYYHFYHHFAGSFRRKMAVHTDSGYPTGSLFNCS